LVAYRQVLKIKPDAKGFYKRYADLIMKFSTSDEELISVLSAGIAAGEADVNMYQKLASIYSKQGNHAKAVQMYEKASQLDTKNVELILYWRNSGQKMVIPRCNYDLDQAIAMNPNANAEL
jgi:tetratricopeptide (TPR) repeat protein